MPTGGFAVSGLRPRLGPSTGAPTGARGMVEARAAFRRALVAAQRPARPPSGAPPAGTLTDLPNGLRGLIDEAARRYGLDPALVAGVIQTESGFNPRAQSGAGAKGLMQLMDATARGLGVSDPFDPVQNVMGGARLLRQLLDRYGDVRLALAAYNAGPGAVDRYGGVPPYAETQRYVPTVLAAAGRQRELARGSGPAADG